jgi:hypothetical protein
MDLPLMDETSYLGSWQHDGLSFGDKVRTSRSNSAPAPLSSSSFGLPHNNNNASSSSSSSFMLDEEYYYRSVQVTRSFASSGPAVRGAIGTDGNFVYVYNHSGLAKLGNGLASSGTVQGHLYASNTEFATKFLVPVASSLSSSSSLSYEDRNSASEKDQEKEEEQQATVFLLPVKNHLLIASNFFKAPSRVTKVGLLCYLSIVFAFPHIFSAGSFYRQQDNNFLFCLQHFERSCR